MSKEKNPKDSIFKRFGGSLANAVENLIFAHEDVEAAKTQTGETATPAAAGAASASSSSAERPAPSPVNSQLVKAILESAEELGTTLNTFTGYVKTFEGIISDESSRYKAAFAAAAKSSKITVNDILSAADEQIESLKIEKDDFLEGIKEKASEVNQLKADMVGIDNKIKELKQQIEDLETLKSEPSINSVVNTNSPLRVDGSMLDGLMEMAQYGQPVIVTPFTLSGAMCPITLAGALAQQHAEALGVITLSQIVNPGAPMVYGGFTSNADMRSGAPAFGTPEYTRAAWASGQLARRYGIPFRSSNTNASNCVDAQAAWESQMSLWGAVMGHAQIIKHAAGWLEGGLCASFEKFIIDVDMLQMMRETLTPLKVDESTLALDAIREAGHGGHFFGTAHTMANYTTAFYEPLVSDWSNFETWTENGALNAFQRANAIYRQKLAEYQPPEMDASKRESLQKYVVDRRRELELAR